MSLFTPPTPSYPTYLPFLGLAEEGGETGPVPRERIEEAPRVVLVVGWEGGLQRKEGGWGEGGENGGLTEQFGP